MSSESSASAQTTPHSRRAFRSAFAWAVLFTVLGLGLTCDLGLKYWTFDNVIGTWRIDPNSAPGVDAQGRPHPAKRIWVPIRVKLDRQRLIAEPDYNPIPPHQGVQILPWSLLDLQLVINRGAVFGMGENRRFFFIAFTLGALAAGLFVFGRFTHAGDRLAHISIGLILAGGIGNLYDRIVYGVVRDFLHMLPGYRLPFGWRWPGGSPDVFPWVFNVADVMLLAGMGLLMLHMSRVERHRKNAELAAKAAGGHHETGAGESKRALTESEFIKPASVSGEGSASS
jgi:lipoprotein signal peptidase